MRSLIIGLIALCWSFSAQAQGQEIVLFWSTTCPPCMAEMRELPTIAQAHPEMTFTLASLSGDAPPIALTPNMQLLPQEKTMPTFISLSDESNAIPFSAALHNTGGICARHHGIVSEELVAEWSKTC